MKDQKRQAIIKLVKIANELELSSITLLNTGADMLKAKERLDKSTEERQKQKTS